MPFVVFKNKPPSPPHLILVAGLVTVLCLVLFLFLELSWGLIEDEENEKRRVVDFKAFYIQGIEKQLRIKHDYPRWKRAKDARKLNYLGVFDYPFLFSARLKARIFHVESFLEMSSKLGVCICFFFLVLFLFLFFDFAFPVASLIGESRVSLLFLLLLLSSVYCLCRTLF